MTLYVTNEQGTEVLCDFRRDGNKTYVLRETDMPAPAWKIAQLMNQAYEQGRKAAQADMRKALGVTT